MNWLKKLFGKKEEVKETQETEVQETPEQQPVETGDEPRCDSCGMAIFPTQKSIMKSGKRLHVKPCWRNLQKEAKGTLGFN